MATLLDALRAELVAQGVGRLPRTNDPNLAPIWVAKSPLPGPGDTAGLNPIEAGRDAVIGLYVAGGIATPRFEAERRRDRVDAWIRVPQNGATTAYRLGAQIRAAVIVDQQNWLMGTDPNRIRVIESLEWAALQPVETGVPGESDTWIYSMLFECYSAETGWAAAA